MADLRVSISVGFRWWVAPYMVMLRCYIHLAALVASEEWVNEFIDHHIYRIVSRGLIVKTL